MSLAGRLAKNAALTLEGIDIICRHTDGYIDANALCKAAGKEFRNWRINQRSKEYLRELSLDMNRPIDMIIKYEDHGPANRTNWVDPRVAVNVAQWISPRFEVKVSNWITELLVCGDVKYNSERSIETIANEQIRQLEAEIREKNNKLDALMLKHMTLSEMVTDLGYKFDIAMDTLTDARQVITAITDRLRHTARYAVPLTLPSNIYETVSVFRVTSNITGEYECHVGLFVQKKGFTTALKRLIKTNEDYNIDLVHTCADVPNATMIRNELRRTLQYYKDSDGKPIMNRNTIKITDTFTEDDLVHHVTNIINSTKNTVERDIATGHKSNLLK
jgi:hypothetical protein